MSKQALLIDYEFCSNCHTCEVECKMEHGFPEGTANGIKVFEVGPWQIEGDRWQLTYMPVPTDMCDLCADRISVIPSRNRHSNKAVNNILQMVVLHRRELGNLLDEQGLIFPR